MRRSARHFHQPMRAWDQAGFKRTMLSSIHWAQNRNQAPGRKASWFDARDTFLSAFTARTDKERNAKFAETFQTVGQVMHLISDSASVPHARDESHIVTYSFDDFVAKLSDLISGSIGFDPTILQYPTGDADAPVPIAFLWDTNFYTGANPPGQAEMRIGLAEFTNANFFSPLTISYIAFKDPELPLPAIDRLDDQEISAPDPRTKKPAKYLSKKQDGVEVTHMVRVASLCHYAGASFYMSPTLDDNVYQDYATYLIPRAIGYSTGILDYFFRGKIKIEPPDRFAYALAPYTEGNTAKFTKFRMKVSNDTEYPNTSEDTDGPGTMFAVVRYRVPTGGENLVENPHAALSDPYYAVSLPKSVDLTRMPQEVPFEFFGADSIPTNAADIFLWVVWQGKLGQETGAIMVGGKDLYEPDPLTFGNGTDYDCYQQSLYHVADLGNFPNYNPPLQAQRDVNSDGYQDIFGAFTDNNIFIKTCSSSALQPASPDLYDFKVPQQQAGPISPQYSRFMLLQDQSVYAFTWTVGSSTEVPSGSVWDIPRTFSFLVQGNLNDYDPAQSAEPKRRVTSSFVYRGVPTFSFHVMVYQGLSRFGPCVSNSFMVPQTFSRIEGQLSAEQP